MDKIQESLQYLDNLDFNSLKDNFVRLSDNYVKWLFLEKSNSKELILRFS